MATCPNCGTKSREDPSAMTVAPVLVAKPLGTWSLAGVQDKTVATERLRLSCRCGWSILGRIENGVFDGDPSTQTYPKEA